MEGGTSAYSLDISKEFYDALTQILWLGYVHCDHYAEP